MTSPERMHACPPDGSNIMPCCGRTPFEVSESERMTLDSAAVTCCGPAPSPERISDEDFNIIDHAINSAMCGQEGQQMARDALGQLRAALRMCAAEKQALQKLADVTGNYLLWAPRQRGHAEVHKRLWAAYREYEAFLDAREKGAE